MIAYGMNKKESIPEFVELKQEFANGIETIDFEEQDYSAVFDEKVLPHRTVHGA